MPLAAVLPPLRGRPPGAAAPRPEGFVIDASSLPPVPTAASDADASVSARVLDRPWAGRRIAIEVVEAVDGRGGRAELDVVRHPGGVTILPLEGAPDDDDPRIVLVRNRRPAVEAVLLELPAGGLEPGEVPLDAARRELAEETGRTAATLVPFGGLLTAPGFCDERLHCFVATGLAEVGQDLEDGEDLEPVAMRASEVLRRIDEGTIDDAKTVAVVLRWDRARRAGRPTPRVDGRR